MNRHRHLLLLGLLALAPACKRLEGAEAKQQQRSIPDPNPRVRQLLEHELEVADHGRRLALLSRAERAADARVHAADERGARGRGQIGGLVSLRDHHNGSEHRATHHPLLVLVHLTVAGFVGGPGHDGAKTQTW